MPNTVSSQVIRVVKAGQEQAFEESLREFFAKAEAIPGQLSVHVRPMEGNEWGILRTFRSEADRDNFYKSDLFQRYGKGGDPPHAPPWRGGNPN